MFYELQTVLHELCDKFVADSNSAVTLAVTGRTRVTRVFIAESGVMSESAFQRLLVPRPNRVRYWHGREGEIATSRDVVL